MKKIKCCEYDPWGCIRKPFLQLTNGLECYITLGCKGLPGTIILPNWSL